MNRNVKKALTQGMGTGAVVGGGVTTALINLYPHMAHLLVLAWALLSGSLVALVYRLFREALDGHRKREMRKSLAWYSRNKEAL